MVKFPCVQRKFTIGSVKVSEGVNPYNSIAEIYP